MESFVSHKFFLESKPDVEFEILPLTEENHLEAAKVCTEAFLLADAIAIAFDFTYDEVYRDFALPIIRLNIENNLGIVCYCPTNKEIVAILLHQRLNLDDIESSDEKVRKARRCITYAYSQNSSQINGWIQKTNECYVLDVISVLPQYQKLGLGAILLEFMLFKHPILKNAKYILAEILNPNMLRLALRKEFEIFWEKRWEDFKFVQGCEDYEHFNKILETKGDVRTEKLALVVFDREKLEVKKTKNL